ncbi:hypothetical protein [Paenibacillus harenae]|uniref:hypothetical protein n=1 Tax=Paenibacillus harenae TaxID=306543 RepID=UPI0004100AEE|nr:hypothetical protein [Paenibacillus harenae]
MRKEAERGMRPAVRLFEGEKWLVATGLLGFLLAGICGLYVLLYGGEVSPAGDVSKAFSFNAALGIFLISTAAVVPMSGMGKKIKAFFRWSYIALVLYSYFAENVQHFRGVNPRFVENGSAFDNIISNGFAFVALMLVLFYVMFAVHFFGKKAYELRPELVLAIRYAMIAVLFSFAAGIWISLGQSRFTGSGGNIIWLHGLGFHALQAIPIVAWLTERASISRETSCGMIHITGVAFLLGLAAIGWQTYLGQTVFEWSALPIAAGVSFLASLTAGALVLSRVSTAGKGNVQAK